MRLGKEWIPVSATFMTPS
ncbi:hypothetical protein IYZ83_000250 [Wolbachia pipientis]|nr:hypothetical protein IYZ83_000250 [Wolbachia pipientis]